MKTTKSLNLAAVALLTLAGCTQDNEPAASGLPMTGTPMRPVVEVTAPVTREAMTTQDLKHYYFRVTDADGGTDEYDYFVEMVKGQDGTWSLAEGSEEMTWKSSFPKVSACELQGTRWDKDRYTNGQNIGVDPGQFEHSVLLESDLLYMVPKVISAEDLTENYSIKVELAHRFAKLKVVVNLTGTPEGVIPSNPISSLSIGGTSLSGRFIPATDELEIIPRTQGDVTPYYAGQSGKQHTYECILVPQTLSGGQLSITARLNDDTWRSYTHASALTLEGNSQYTLTLNMDVEMPMTPSGDVEVGEWDDETNIDGEQQLFLSMDSKHRN